MSNSVIEYFKCILQGEELSLLREGVDVECKLAVGKSGKGGLPLSIWNTYSAFANTNGGIIVLGVKELSDGGFELKGVENVQQLKTDFFNTINNKDKVSQNILSDKLVSEWTVNNKSLLLIAVPRATRKQQPIYLNSNPLGNTFIRQHEGDFRLDDEAVKRMLAEQAYDERDGVVLDKFGLDDLSIESLRAYRQRYSNLNPNAELSEKSDIEFLRRIGAYAKDREAGIEGLTKAGLLMFGLDHTIMEVFPNYMLDYQEQSNDKDVRWVDRIVPDGTWSGNLYDFYFKVYKKLTEDLKIPFALKDGMRQEDTPVHTAIREALVNSLVHADYSERASVLIIKKPDGFSFRNPGLMRVPVEQVFRGGESDGRNRRLHKMFRLINVGEQAGSGGPKIISGWEWQHWQTPYLYEKREPNNQTVLELKTVDLFPSHTIQQLERQFGVQFSQLSKLERVALAIAKLEDGVITHTRLHAISNEHSVEATRALQHLVKLGFLHSSGGRGAVYTLDGVEHIQPEDIFGSPSTENSGPSIRNNESSTGNSESSTGNSESSTGNSESSTGNKDKDFEGGNVQSLQRDGMGRIAPGQLPLPVIDDITRLSADLLENIEEIALEALTKKRLSPSILNDIILSLCKEQFFTTKALSQILNREISTLRKQYLAPLVKEQKLLLAFPNTPTHEKQAYRTNITLECRTKEYKND
ncbi:RNA-binding domain-containing protein [Oligella urethralis]|uniref:RNA-binding domain-containing protein n=2 Tax=Oligella urethralis TaxID=90245 RepID=UPI0024309A72|nr:RNA-binding domain-containing protein [Oligella urethralis]